MAAALATAAPWTAAASSRSWLGSGLASETREGEVGVGRGSSRWTRRADKRARGGANDGEFDGEVVGGRRLERTKTAAFWGFRRRASRRGGREGRGEARGHARRARRWHWPRWQRARRRWCSVVARERAPGGRRSVEESGREVGAAWRSQGDEEAGREVGGGHGVCRRMAATRLASFWREVGDDWHCGPDRLHIAGPALVQVSSPGELFSLSLF